MYRIVLEVSQSSTSPHKSLTRWNDVGTAFCAKVLVFPSLERCLLLLVVMKNRLKLYFESDRKSAQPKAGKPARNLKQFKLITLHTALSQEMRDADHAMKSHYELLLLSLKLLIDAYGPCEWKVRPN